MALKDTKNGYGEISLLNHWTVAIFVFAMLSLGLVYDFLPKSDSREMVINWHASLGLIAFPIIVWRVIWRIKYGFPKTNEKNKLESFLKKAMHNLLLVSLILLVFTGPMYLWTEAEPLPFFGLFEIPSPFSEESEWLHETVETVHKKVANPILIGLLAVHFLAALKSIFWDKKDTFIQR